jgi:BolA protein
MNRVELLRARLQTALSPTLLEIRDDSALHVGHAGAREGGGHFHVTVASEAFVGLNTLARHRLIYTAVADLMPTTIHALAIDARLPA